MPRDDLKSQPHEPNKTPLELVQELCAMEVYFETAGKKVPLPEALARARDEIDIARSTPELLAKEYGRADIFPAVESLIKALDHYVKGEATDEDKNFLRDEARGVFEALIHQAYRSADIRQRLAERLDKLDDSESSIEERKFLHNLKAVVNDADTLDETFDKARDWRLVCNKALEVQAAMQRQGRAPGNPQ